MKELGVNTESKDQIKNVRQKEVEKQQKQVGQLKPHKGHTVFEYNVLTGELVPAVIEDVISVQKHHKDLPPTKHRKIIVKEGCVYVSALNIKNAVKKLAKYYGNKIKF